MLDIAFSDSPLWFSIVSITLVSIGIYWMFQKNMETKKLVHQPKPGSKDDTPRKPTQMLGDAANDVRDYTVSLLRSQPGDGKIVRFVKWILRFIIRTLFNHVIGKVKRTYQYCKYAFRLCRWLYKHAKNEPKPEIEASPEPVVFPEDSEDQCTRL